MASVQNNVLKYYKQRATKFIVGSNDRDGADQSPEGKEFGQTVAGSRDISYDDLLRASKTSLVDMTGKQLHVKGRDARSRVVNFILPKIS
jgi:hypothetical protein